ncbi:MAG TPA: FecR domain-containing protein [Puia sp.]
MDFLPTYDNFPWDLIVSALRGDLSPDEDLQFRQWLADNPDNQQKYDQLQQLWKEGMADYIFYQEADEVKAWDALQRRMGDRGSAGGNTGSERDEAKVISASFRKRAPLIKRLVTVAAVFLLAIGTGWWYFFGKNGPILYETAVNEQRKISLPDGSTMVLKPQTRIQLVRRYNKASRTVILTSGEAFFEISHHEELPFIVDMETASIKDIGTSFTVQKTEDSIKVMVFSGKVAFSKKEAREAMEISAGSSLCFYIREERFGEIRATDTAGSGAGSLRFDNSPLSDVIAALQKVSGKKISLTDTVIGQKRLNVNLEGESLDNALKIICASLNLEYAGKNGTYILKTKDTANHH